MKKAYVAENPVNANLLKDRLADAGIQATIQNELMSALYGGLPAFNLTVWVRDEDYEAARKVAGEFECSQTSPPATETWTCPKCGEKIEGHFEECWKCDAEGPEGEEHVAQPRRMPLGLWLFVLVVAALIVVFAMSRSNKRSTPPRVYPPSRPTWGG